MNILKGKSQREKAPQLTPPTQHTHTPFLSFLTLVQSNNVLFILPPMAVLTVFMLNKKLSQLFDQLLADVCKIY